MNAFGSLLEFGLSEKVRKRIVTGQDHIKAFLNRSAEIPEVGNSEAQCGAEFSGVLLGSFDRFWTEVGCMDLITSQGQTNGLCANSTGAIEKPELLRLSVHSPPNEPMEHLRLPFDVGVPILPNEVIALGELLVEVEDGAIHRFIPVPLLRAT